MNERLHDFALINALGQDHLGDTAEAPGQAADRYAERKKTRNNTEKLCLEAGYRFWPVVHEVQGGTAKGADAAIRAIAESVATREDRDPASVRRELCERIAILVARCSARAIRRRDAPRGRAHPSWAAKVAELQLEHLTEI